MTLTLLPPMARLPDLDRQFAGIRQSLETGLNWRNMRGAQAQHSAGPGFETRVHVATYATARGDLHIALMSRAEGGSVGTLLFTAATAQAYDRLRGVATNLFDGLHIVASTAAAAPGMAPVQPPVPLLRPRVPPPGAAAPGRAVAGGAGTADSMGGASVWMTFKILYGSFSSGENARWLTMFHDGEVLDDIPDAGLAGFDRAAAHANPNLQSWWGVLRGGEITKPGVTYPIKVTPVADGKIKLDSDVYNRSVPVDGLRLDGAWTSYSNPNDPALDRLPPGQRPVFRFTRDGRFIDEGVFLTAMPAFDNPATGGTRPGQGQYEIAAFTLILRYDDGRMKRLACTGLLGADPRSADSTLYFSRMRFNKRR